MSNEIDSKINKLWDEIHKPNTNKINQYIQRIHTGQYSIIDDFYTQIEQDLRRYIVSAKWYINNTQKDVENNIRTIADSIDGTQNKCIALYNLFYNTCNEIYKMNDLDLLCMQIMILLEDNESNYFREEYEKQNRTKQDYVLNVTYENPNIHIYVTSNEIEIKKQITYHIHYVYTGDNAIDNPSTEIIKKQKYYTYKLVSQEIMNYLYNALSSIQEKAFYYIMNKKQMSQTDNPVEKIGMIRKTKNPEYCNIDFTDEISKYEGTMTKSTGKALIKSFTGPLITRFKAFINGLIANNHFDNYHYETVVKKLLVFDDTELQKIYNKYEKIFANKMPMITMQDQTQNSNACSQLFVRTFSNTQDETAFLCYCILLYDYYDKQQQDVMQLKKYIYSRYILQYAPEIIQKYEDTDKYILLDISKWYTDIISITANDIANSIIDNPQDSNPQQKKFQLYQPLYDKISLFFENYIQNNDTNLNPVLDTKRFEHVYITSDIHSDLRKFVQTLVNNGIIEIKKSDGTAFKPYDEHGNLESLKIHLDNLIQRETDNKRESDNNRQSVFLQRLDRVNSDIVNSEIAKKNFNEQSDIYSPELIINIVWKKKNTLLVIIGDLVDGGRPLDNNPVYINEVYDPEGSFELRLHMFLYNMRIQAMQNDSEVRFSLGNHDIGSVLSDNKNNIYSTYEHDTLKKFYYDNHTEKRNSLLPFYRCSPYLYLALKNKYDRYYEVFCVHAGLDNISKINEQFMGVWLDAKQNEYIEIIKNIKNNPSAENSFLNTLLHINYNNPFLYRKYSKNISNMTPELKKELNDKLKNKYEKINHHETKNQTFITLYNTLLNDEIKGKPKNNYMQFVQLLELLDKHIIGCNNIPDNIKTLVVGHCITNSGDKYSTLSHSYHNRNDESQCSGKGCIAYGCKKDGIYRLVFVDTGMARQNNSFERESENTYNQNRPIEMLYLKKTENNRGQGNTYEQRRTIAENLGTIQNTESLNTLVKNPQLGGKKITRKNRLHMKTRRRQKYFAKQPSKKNKRTRRKS